eukprot:350570-Ditylum_brightwellii.AAC.1
MLLLKFIKVLNGTILRNVNVSLNDPGKRITFIVFLASVFRRNYVSMEDMQCYLLLKAIKIVNNCPKVAAEQLLGRELL